MTSFNWKQRYDGFHTTFPAYTPRPLIGITGNFADGESRLSSAYYDSILAAGGEPVILPPTFDAGRLPSLLDRLDGLLLSGGADVNPLFCGENPLPQLHGINARRDEFELLLTRLAYDRQIPILGICRGIQVLALALDGCIYQDIEAQAAGAGKDKKFVKHSQDAERDTPTHTVSIEKGSMLSRLFNGAEGLAVNSFHHQAVAEPGPCLKVSAQSPDGIIEAVESAGHKAILGVQWHPEAFLTAGNRSMLPIFSWLTSEAQLYREARNLHGRILTLDSHCDTPMFFDRNIKFATRDPQILVDLHKMAEGGLDATIMVAYLEQKGRTDAELLAATKKADDILTRIENMAAQSGSAVALAYTPADLHRLKREGRRAVMMGIENGYAIGKDLSRVAHFRARGVVYMTLCHNGDNDICDSARRSTAEHGGLSAFGREVVAEMNRVGMMVDLSHAAETSFYDALECSSTPIVCSHSSARALCDHPRNLTDDQLRRLAQKGGVAQVTFYNGFLRTDGRATINDAVEHLMHMIKIAGTEHVGIGTDFDGDGGVPGLDSASELINFTKALLRKKFSEDDLQKIWGGNFLRVMQQVQSAARMEP